LKLIAITMMMSLLSACGGGLKDEKGEFNFFTVEEATIKRYVNDKPLPSDPDFTQDKTVLNRDYPIEIALYNDGKWSYDLPNLGKGQGTYEYKNGRFQLFAERSLFDMYIDIVATDQNAEKVVLKFSDRFGPRILKTEKINFD